METEEKCVSGRIRCVCSSETYRGFDELRIFLVDFRVAEIMLHKYVRITQGREDKVPGGFRQRSGGGFRGQSSGEASLGWFYTVAPQPGASVVRFGGSMPLIPLVLPAVCQ